MEERIESQILSIGENKASGMRAVRLLSIALAPILSGALLVFPFPKYDVSWLVWVGLVPLLMTISGRSTRIGFYSSYVCGVVFFSGVFSWALAIPGYKLLHQGLLAFYASFYFAFFGLIFCYIAKRSGVTYAHLAAPFIWVGLEYVRSNFGFLALPWPLLSHAQYQHPLIIQFATLTGAYGVSFLIVLVNSAIAAVLLPLVYRSGQNHLSHHQIISNRGRNALAGSAALLVALALLYGNAVLSEPLTGKKIKLSVLQGNIDQEKKRKPLKHDRYILQRYSELTQQASKNNPAIIVWPEAATPGFIFKNMTALSKIMSIVREVKTPFLIGSSEYSKFAKDPAVRGKSGNTAIFFSPEGKVLGQHLKIRLLPFAEYLPYEGIIPWPDYIIPLKRRNWESPGKEFTLFDLDGARFGTIICWENAFPNLFRQFVKNGADFMLNITNEGWFGDTAAPYQFLAMCVFRSVENRISMARAANTGISGFIDPYGRVTGRVWNNNKDTFVAGYLTGQIHLSEAKTFYTHYGDIFVYITLVVTALFMALSFLKARK
jgi:apolipoprotein N-acyltransferase